MIVGIGVDIVDLARFSATLTRVPRLRERLFTAAEAGLAPHSLAGRFAAKEALFKALGSPGTLVWRDAEIRRGAAGRPEVYPTGSVAARTAELGVTRLHLSISHDGPLAIAQVIAEATGKAGEEAIGETAGGTLIGRDGGAIPGQTPPER